MERNREGRRGGGAGGVGGSVPAGASRRPRVSGPKDASDEDDRMDDNAETRPWERPRKERINSFHLSVSGNPPNKRKRQGPQEAQVPGRSSACDDGDESTEDAENAASEDDDEPPPPPILRRPGKSRGNGKVKVRPAETIRCNPQEERLEMKCLNSRPPDCDSASGILQSEDEIVMDIPAVPRKARSLMTSSSRFTPVPRRQPEPLPADTPRQQSPVAPQTSLNGISSSNIHGKPGRRLKSGGAKIRGVKLPKVVSEPSTISDKEVEVAEALFDLARSMPSHSGSALDQKPETKLETEVVKAASPSNVPALSPASVALPNISGPGSSTLQAIGSNANGNIPQVRSSVLPTAEAPRRKRPRVTLRQDEFRAMTPIRAVPPGGASYSAMHPLVGETEQTSVSEKSQSPSDKGLSAHPEPLKAKIAVESSQSVTQPQDNEDAKISSAEYRSKAHIEPKESEENLQYNSDMYDCKGGQPDSRSSSPNNVKVEASENTDEFPSRPSEFDLDDDSNCSKVRIDLMAPPLTLPSKEDTAHEATVDQHISSVDISINVASQLTEGPHVKVENLSEGQKDAEDAGMGLNGEEMEEDSTKIKEVADSVNKELKEEQIDQSSGQLQKEQMSNVMQRERPSEGEREKERDSVKLLSASPIKTQKPDSGTLPTSSFLMSTFPATASSSAPVALAGWMPHFGYYGSGAPPWAAGASLPGVNIDNKTAHPAVQLPQIAVLPPVPRMKHCATHVYLAHFIYREQQRVRHTLWPTALCRGTPYNLNIPPVNMHEKEKMGATHVDPARKAPAQQAGLAFGFSVSQSTAAGVTVSSGTLGGITTGNSMSAPSLSSTGVSVEAGSGTAAGNVMSMAHTQYLQAMIQQNGFAPFSFPVGGPPGQAAQYFNSPFFPPHLVPTLPQFQSLVQQAPNMQKQQQGLRTVPHSTSSQLLPPPQQQLQLQLAPQSPSNSQQPQQLQQQHHHQHHHMGATSQQFGAHSEEDSTVGGESHSTAESRLSAMQRSMCGQGPSNLPNLNLSPSSLMLTTSVPALPSHHQDVSVVAALGGKHTGKSQSVQQQQLIPQNTGTGPGLHMKGLDPSISQGYSPMTISSLNRSSVGPSPLGLVSVASVMGTQGHGVLPGSSENLRGHGQQQQGLGNQNQQYNQRAGPKAPVIEDTFMPSSSKGRDSIDDRKSSVKQVGGPLNLTRVDMEVSSPPVQGSPTSGSSSPAPRLVNNLGRTLNLANSGGARNPRPVSSVGAGQVPHSQSQTSKQPTARSKGSVGTNISQVTAPPTVSSYALPANLGKIQGTGLPFAGQMAPCSQGLKQGPASIGKVGQRTSQGGGIPAASNVPQAAVGTMTKNPGLQTRSNQQGPSITGTAPRLPPGSTPVLPSVPLSLSTSHSQSALKAAGVPVSTKSASNGKGTVPTSKSGPVSVKRSSVSGPAVSSVVGPGQNTSVKVPLQQKSQGQLSLPQFSQQQATVAPQHQQLGTKHQVYHQQQTQQGSQFKQSFPPQAQYRPQPFLQQHHQQYLQHSPLQQQSLAQQHTQQPSSHYFQQNPQSSASQHGHLHQHLRHDQHHSHLQQQAHSMSMPTSSSATTNNGLSLSPPNLTLGTGIPGNSSVTTSTDGTDQCQGLSSRSNTSKGVSSPGNQLSTGGIPKNSAALHPSSTSVSGQQIGNPHSGSSHYLQLAPVLGVKSTEQKTLPESVNREEFGGMRHLASSSNSQTPLVSNPSSS